MPCGDSRLRLSSEAGPERSRRGKGERPPWNRATLRPRLFHCFSTNSVL